jgi:hypothetical protein
MPPPLQVVPVYSLPEDGNALIRGYTACPAYDARLLDWWERCRPRCRTPPPMPPPGRAHPCHP